MKEIYLGDSVYMRDDGHGITLFLSNGETKTSPILLEQETILNLLNQLTNLKSTAKDACKACSSLSPTQRKELAKEGLDVKSTVDKLNSFFR